MLTQAELLSQLPSNPPLAPPTPSWFVEPLRCYVYAHVCAETGAYMYVGMGESGSRAWTAERPNPSHRYWLESQFESGQLMGDIVRIFARGLSRSDALELESALMDTLRPPFNLEPLQRDTKRNRGFDRRLANVIHLNPQSVGYRFAMFPNYRNETK